MKWVSLDAREGEILMNKKIIMLSGGPFNVDNGINHRGGRQQQLLTQPVA
jgi:hypothetical protein